MTIADDEDKFKSYERLTRIAEHGCGLLGEDVVVRLAPPKFDLMTDSNASIYELYNSVRY